MGRSNCELESLVLDIVSRHAPEVTENEVNTRPSGKGNFISVTVTVKATSREQLDAIYEELTASEYIMMAL